MSLEKSCVRISALMIRSGTFGGDNFGISSSYKIVILFFSLLILCGCATGGKKHPPQKKISQAPESEYSAKVLRPSFLKKEGTTLIVVPFTAGIGVEADKDLDRISLWIVKGIIDTLNRYRYDTRFKVLPIQEADQADLVIQGHITGRKKIKTRKNWMFPIQEVVLSVEARMTERKTGNLVLIYSRQRKAPLTKEEINDEMILAQELGKDIAIYILGDVL